MRHPARMPDGLPLHLDDVPIDRWEVGELAATRRRLGAAAGARRLGIALTRIDPGKRSTPPHSHADEDEVFLVLEGSGLSWQSSGSRDVRTYAIGVDDVLWHPSNGDAHTLIAGDDGLTVLVVAEGSRTNITWLPRTRQFWLGPRWSPGRHAAAVPGGRGARPARRAGADGGAPADDPQPRRPPAQRGSRGRARLRDARRSRHGLGQARARPGRDAARHPQHRPALPLRARGGVVRPQRERSRAARRGGACAARRVVLAAAREHRRRPPDRGRPGGHGARHDGRPDRGDVVVYPEKRTFKPARGLELPY